MSKWNKNGREMQLTFPSNNVQLQHAPIVANVSTKHTTGAIWVALMDTFVLDSFFACVNTTVAFRQQLSGLFLYLLVQNADRAC